MCENYYYKAYTILNHHATFAICDCEKKDVAIARGGGRKKSVLLITGDLFDAAVFV